MARSKRETTPLAANWTPTLQLVESHHEYKPYPISKARANRTTTPMGAN